MKGFKKLALVAAIAAPMTSVHALEALDDSVLSDMTGQSGVTIDLETKVSIGSVTWLDTDQGGSVSMRGITIGGAAPGSKLDDIRLIIDAGQELRIGSSTMFNKVGAGLASQADTQARIEAFVGGDATALTAEEQAILGANGAEFLIGKTAMDDIAAVADVTTDAGKDALKIEVRSSKNQTVDLGVGLDEVYMGGWTTNLMSGFSMDMIVGPQDIVIYEDAADKAHIDMAGYFKITDMDMNIDAIGLGIEDMAIGDIDWANTTFSETAGASYAFNGGALSKRLITQYLEAVNSGDADKIAAAAAKVEANSVVTAAALTADPDAIYNLLAPGAVSAEASGHAQYAMDITTTDVAAAGGLAGVDNALQVNVKLFRADIGIGAMNIGGNSLGSLAIDDLVVTDTSFTVFGH